MKNKSMSLDQDVCEKKNIYVKSSGIKHKITISNTRALKQLEAISTLVSIPLSRLKLVAKGQQVDRRNILQLIFDKNCTVFMVPKLIYMNLLY